MISRTSCVFLFSSNNKYLPKTLSGCQSPTKYFSMAILQLGSALKKSFSVEFGLKIPLSSPRFFKSTTICFFGLLSTCAPSTTACSNFRIISFNASDWLEVLAIQCCMRLNIPRSGSRVSGLLSSMTETSFAIFEIQPAHLDNFSSRNTQSYFTGHVAFKVSS